MIKEWFNEAVLHNVNIYKNIYKSDNYEYIFYKGFKITKLKEEDEYYIQDIRINDFYTNISEKQISNFKKYGFIKGADIMSYKRNYHRMVFYIKKLEKLYEEKEIVEKELKTNFFKKNYVKKLKNYQENINKYRDLLIFYKIKINQHKLKYNE